MKKTTRCVGTSSNDEPSSDGGPIIEAIVDASVDLGVDPTKKPVPLYDVVDAEALALLVKRYNGGQQNSYLQVSFFVWGIHFLVTPREVIATRLG